MHITIGKVSAAPDARQHLDILGRAHCGAGNGRTIAATRWRVDGTILLTEVCLRCLTALRRRIAAAAATGDDHATDAAVALTPTDPRRDAAMIAEMRAHIIAARVPDPTPLQLSGLPAHLYTARLLASLHD